MYSNERNGIKITESDIITKKHISKLLAIIQNLLEEVKNLLKNNMKPKKNIAIKDVVKIVSEYFKLEEASVYEKTRKKEIVKARQVVMYLLREDFNVSYPLIGQKLGGKDHTTVIHSCLKIKNDLKNDPQLLQELEQIRIMFK